MIELHDLLAQATTAPTAQPSAGLRDLLMSPLMLIALFLILLMYMNARGRKKEQRKYEDMLNALKRNDRVQTAGGVIGTVVDVREGEVILKVDETSNVKMRFARSAIKAVIQEASATDEK
jgi:preprotein translocase subunit YajC